MKKKLLCTPLNREEVDQLIAQGDDPSLYYVDADFDENTKVDAKTEKKKKD